MILKNKKRLKKVVFISIILILILSILIVLIERNAKQKEEINKEQEIIKKQIDNYFSDKICPKNSSSLYSNYKGKNNKNELYKNFKIFIDNLPQFISNLNNKNETELIQYFEVNKDDIYEYLGTKEKKEFLNIAKYLQTKKITENSFDYCEIDETSFENDENQKYLSFDLKFYFKNNAEDLKLKIYFANFTKTNPQIKYNVAY